VSRRARGVAFGIGALACAALSAHAVAGYSAGVKGQFGPLRPAVVATRPLPAHRRLAARSGLEVRRVPARFLPPGTLSAPAQAIGRSPLAPVPSGAYLLASQLEVPGEHHRDPGLRLRGAAPVEIAVTGAAALAASGQGPVGRRVDVIVTAEPRGAQARGRTYVAAENVRLLDLRQADGGVGDANAAAPLPDAWVATLALDRSQALRLIEAQNYAREVRLVPHLGG
jgi:Flp pilus assembly protein CpaB